MATAKKTTAKGTRTQKSASTAKGTGFHKSGKTQNTKAKDDVTLEVLEELGTFAVKGRTEFKLRYIKWNDADPTYDLRGWYIDGEGNERSAKGFTLTGEQLEQLSDLLNSLR